MRTGEAEAEAVAVEGKALRRSSPDAEAATERLCAGGTAGATAQLLALPGPVLLFPTQLSGVSHAIYVQPSHAFE